MGMEAITPSQLATRFAGSSDLYGDDGRQPSASVNFMVAHDGFTLKDLYSCNSKNNSSRGPTALRRRRGQQPLLGPRRVGADQRQAARTGLGFLMLNAGVPMITRRRGAEGDQLQQQPYNLDSSPTG